MSSRKIIDSFSKEGCRIRKPSGEIAGFEVLTRPSKEFISYISPFLNVDYGEDMNQNVGINVSEWIHDGLDNVYWTGAAITGTWVFNSVDQNHTPLGAQSVNAVATVNGNVAQFLRVAGNLTLAAPISVLSVWIYLTGFSVLGTKHIEFYGWNTGTGAIVGNSVNLDDYINTNTLNVWQRAIIPLGDMGLVNQIIDAVRVRTVNIGAGPPPNYYLDDLQVNDDATPLEYIIEPPEDYWLYINTISISIADAYDSTLANATLPNFSYNAIMGEAALDNGILYQRIQNGEIKKSFVARQLSDWLEKPNSIMKNGVDDDTNAYINIQNEFPYPEILKYEKNDKLKILIEDDLSGLLMFKMYASGRAEYRKGEIYG